ncbi:MBL fold metallo-hydrolase [Desulfospira joergensenii]|uniref:MBL fold metallo-hydrolase n=1 Tax=Desulfospira joergensenii TaxID=53329 RepID=UPI000481751C|nr:MBL fold metallo-hydrolase [Desulfospira joergensenii]
MKLNSHVQRIAHCGLHVDLVKTSQGWVRLGSMPDIAKMMSFHGFREEIVIVPPWEGSMAGDNYTGEEFVLWQAQVKGSIKRLYAGTPEDLHLLYRNLDETFSFFFDRDRIGIVKKRWLKQWFEKSPASPVYEKNSLKILIENRNIILTDQGRILYNRKKIKASHDPDTLVEEALGKAPRDSSPRPSLEITAIGTGNGFVGTTASCIVRFAKEVVWIDPCGYPAHTLARRRVHWDDITHILITHNHEDHVQGFSACLKRAEKTGRPINLITAPSIHEVLKKQFTPLCPDFARLTKLIPLFPGKKLGLDSMKVECRWNHHFLPYGTLGLKFTAGGKCFGFSGDTKFNDHINSIVAREELLPQWFADCDLLFHEVDFDNPDGVHTHWKALEELARSIPGQVLGYHTPYLANAPLPLVEQGKTYCL